jgi:hypothetical protein
MKTVNQSEAMKGCLTAAWIVAGALLLGAPITSRAINSAAPTAGAVNLNTLAAPNAPAMKSSPGVADIVKMVDAKVDPEVVKTYIQNSPTAYNPSATEIIALRDHGVGTDILTAMLQHGANVRAQAMRAAPAAANPLDTQAPPGAVNPYAPAYDYRVQPASASYAYTYPDASYAYSSYAYAYPSYYYGGYNYGSYWPWYWPSFSFGCYSLGSYCGYPYRSYGYGHPYYYGGYGHGNYYGDHGYYGGGYNGGHAYYGGHPNTGGHPYTGGHGYSGGHAYPGGHAYSGNRGYNYGSGARPASFGGYSAGYHSFGGGGRPATFGGSSGGFRTAGGFSGHAASFSGSGGSFGGHAGASGGHSMGRSR